MPPERVCISTDCSIASMRGVVARKKLSAMVEATEHRAQRADRHEVSRTESVRPADSFVADPGEGAHIAVLYRGPDGRDEVLIPYLAGARQHDEGALCITDVDPDTFAGQVTRAAGMPGSVEVFSSAATYLRGGAFLRAGDDQLGGRDRAGRARVRMPRGCVSPGICAGSKHSSEEGFDELIEYETSLNALAPSCRHTLACFYDLALLDADRIVALLRAHPQVVIDGALWDSPFYVEDAGDADRAAALDACVRAARN